MAAGQFAKSRREHNHLQALKELPDRNRLLFRVISGAKRQMTLAASVQVGDLPPEIPKHRGHLMAMHAEYWILTHPVNKFWIKDLNLRGTGAGFFAVGKDNLAAQAVGADEKWLSFRKRREYSHVFRAALSAMALILLIVAVALRRNAY